MIGPSLFCGCKRCRDRGGRYRENEHGTNDDKCGHSECGNCPGSYSGQYRADRARPVEAMRALLGRINRHVFSGRLHAPVRLAAVVDRPVDDDFRPGQIADRATGVRLSLRRRTPAGSAPVNRTSHRDRPWALRPRPARASCPGEQGRLRASGARS